MKLVAASLSDTGQVRQTNEDFYGDFYPKDPQELENKGWLFVVADGMGGHKGGEIASKLAVETILSAYFADEGDDRSAALRNAFVKANGLILDESTADTALFGMGTTCTAMAVYKEQAYFGHVGDSRAYLYRGGELIQITQDHSLVGEMVRSGIISDEDARVHPKRHVITRSLGVQQSIAADTPRSPFDLHDGDVFMICSDGLTSLVEDDQIEEVLASSDPENACRKLVELANTNGGRDNITVQVIHVKKG